MLNTPKKFGPVISCSHGRPLPMIPISALSIVESLAGIASAEHWHHCKCDEVHCRFGGAAMRVATGAAVPTPVFHRNRCAIPGVWVHGGLSALLDLSSNRAHWTNTAVTR